MVYFKKPNQKKHGLNHWFKPIHPDIWNFFTKRVVEGRKGCGTICKKCHKAMEGQIARMKSHNSACSASDDAS